MTGSAESTGLCRVVHARAKGTQRQPRELRGQEARMGLNSGQNLAMNITLVRG